MNAVAPTGATPVSQELAFAVAAALNPHPDAPRDLPALSDRAKGEIAARLRTLNAELQLAAPEHWRTFLKPLVFSVGNPPNQDEFAAKVSAIAFGLSHIPASLLTPDRSAEALRRFKFWPSVSELGDWLSPLASALRAERSALERLRDARPALPSAADDPAVSLTTPEDRQAAMAKTMAAFKQAMAAGQDMHRRMARGGGAAAGDGRPKATPYSPLAHAAAMLGTLRLGGCEAKHAPAMRMRLAALLRTYPAVAEELDVTPEQVEALA